MRDGEAGDNDMAMNRCIEVEEENRMLETAIGGYSPSNGLSYASMVSRFVCLCPKDLLNVFIHISLSICTYCDMFGSGMEADKASFVV